jgi:hypothetical protein
MAKKILCDFILSALVKIEFHANLLQRLLARLNEKWIGGGGEPSGLLKSTPPKRIFPESVSPSSLPSYSKTPRGRMPFI